MIHSHVTGLRTVTSRSVRESNTKGPKGPKSVSWLRRNQQWSEERKRAATIRVIPPPPAPKARLRATVQVVSELQARSSDLPAVTLEALASFQRRNPTSLLTYREVVGTATQAAAGTLWVQAATIGARGCPPEKKKKAKPQASGKMVENPAYAESYHQIPDVRDSLNVRPMMSSADDSRKMQNLLNLHRDQESMCCVQRSVLAYCSDPAEFNFVEALDWGLQGGPDAMGTFTGFCAIRKRPLRVYQVGVDGLQLLLAVEGSVGMTDVNVVMGYVRGGSDFSAFMNHAMPCSHMPDQIVANGPGYRKMQRLAADFQRCLDAQIAEIMASMALAASPPPQPEPELTLSDAPVELVPFVEPQIAPISEPIAESPQRATNEMSCQTDWDGTYEQCQTSELCGRSFFCSTKRQVILPFTGEPVEQSRLLREFSPFRSDGAECQTEQWCNGLYCKQQIHKTVHCEGLTPELQWHVVRDFGEQRGFGGFLRFAVDVSDEGSPYGANALGNVFAPDLCLATVIGVRKWGLRTRYMCYDECKRTVVDGASDIQLNSSVSISNCGTTYRFVRNDFVGCCYCITAYSLVPVRYGGSITARFRRMFETQLPLLSDFSHASVKGCYPGALLDEQEYEAKWMLEHHCETDAASALLIARERGKALTKPNYDQSPEVVASRLRELRRGYSSIPDVGGSFGWGYCYSCGSSNRGTYRSRICKGCERSNSLLGNLVATGGPLCTVAAPLRHPGLVHCRAQHPPLKTGTTTLADSTNLKCWLKGRGGKKRLSISDVLKMSTLDTRGPDLGAVGLDGAIPFITAGGARPLVEAIAYRVFKDLVANGAIKPEEVCFLRATELADSDLLLGSWLRNPPTIMEVRDWIASQSQRRRRVMLNKALNDWEERGTKHPDFAIITPFVKKELLAFFGRDQKRMLIHGGLPHDPTGCLDKTVKYVARLIQAPHDETHLIAGPVLKPMVKTLKECWHADNWIFYGSVAPAKLSHWLQRIVNCRSFFWSDYSAFDSTFSDHTWRMIEGFYRRLHPTVTPDFWSVMDVWRRPHGKAYIRKQNVQVEYQANVCNCSGRDDTALANALFNGIALSTAFAAALAGKGVDDLTEADLFSASQVCKIAIVGDDSLVGCDFDIKLLEDSVIDQLKRYGLIVTAESSYNLEDVTFLGMMPYKTGQGMEWGPTLGRRLFKLFWMKEQGCPHRWSRGVAQAMAQFKNVPILRELSEKVDELLHSHSVQKMEVDENRPWTAPPSGLPDWDESTLQWVSSRYRSVGVTPEMIRGDLELIQRIDRLPCVVRFETLERILLVDDL